MDDELFKPFGLLLCQYILRAFTSVANLVWHSCQRQINLLVKLVNNNYLRTKSLFFSFQQIPALSEQCSPVAIVIADTAPYFRLVFWLLLPWDLHLSLPHSTCCSSPTLLHCLCALSIVKRFLHLMMLSLWNCCQNQWPYFRFWWIKQMMMMTVVFYILTYLFKDQHVCALVEIWTMSKEKLFQHKWNRLVFTAKLIYTNSVFLDYTECRWLSVLCARLWHAYGKSDLC